jgi:hypothetical protein
VRKIGPPPLRRLDLLLEIQRSPLVDDALIIAPEIGSRRRKDLVVGVADDCGDRHALEPLELAVDEDVAPVQILDEDCRRRVVDDSLRCACTSSANDDGGDANAVVIGARRARRSWRRV